MNKSLRESDFGLPGVQTVAFTNIFDWSWTDTVLMGYQSLPVIKMPVAV